MFAENNEAGALFAGLASTQDMIIAQPELPGASWLRLYP